MAQGGTRVKRIAAVMAALLLIVAAGCDRSDLIGAPQNGQIVPGDTVTVTGVLPADVPGGGIISANGVTTTVAADRTWSVDIPQAPSGYVTPVEVIYTPPSGPTHRQRTAVVHADKVDEGQMSPEGVGMRFTNEGLTGLGPVIESLAGGAFDIGGLLLAQNPIINQQDAFLTLDIVGNVYEAGIGGVDARPAEHRRGHRHADHDRRPVRRREPAHHRRARHQHRLRARAADPRDHDRRHVRPRAHRRLTSRRWT